MLKTLANKSGVGLLFAKVASKQAPVDCNVFGSCHELA